jgi:Arc/MetJ-type ribon-helix-helix transcriptional regulator
MSKTRRVVFSFDERSLESLQKLTEQGRFSSMADTVRDSLQITRALQGQAQQGYTEVVVRNPETNEESVLVIPNLKPTQGSGKAEKEDR